MVMADKSTFLTSANGTGLALALSSSAFIGASFIIKKKGLWKASQSGTRAGADGHAYLKEPLWWAGMVTMILGEIANFSAYAYAPAVLVTPLGALSVIISAILASWLLNERLHAFGKIGCFICILGSTVIVVESPDEAAIESVEEVSRAMMQPAFIVYAVLAVAVSLFLVFFVAPKHGRTNILVYIMICSLIGSLSVMACKGLGTALRLSFSGNNQFKFASTYVFAIMVGVCVVTQMNYLNKALDIFNTAVVTPIYYVTFTVFTIVASVILFNDWKGKSGNLIIAQLCGLFTIMSGVYLLHATKDFGVDGPSHSHAQSNGSPPTPHPPGLGRGNAGEYAPLRTADGNESDDGDVEIAVFEGGRKEGAAAADGNFQLTAVLADNSRRQSRGAKTV
eukprot:Opistho-2@27661